MTISSKINGRRAVISITGRIDTITAPRLEREIKAVTEHTSELVLDFSSLDYISSAGLRSMLTSKKQLPKGCTMEITGCNDELYEIFEITGFNDIFDLKR